MKLSLDCILIFGLIIFCTNVLSTEDGLECVKHRNECVKRRSGATNLSVYGTGETDGIREPFLAGHLDSTTVNYISMRSRNKKVKLVGFYECSTKYESYCGVEKEQSIVDCKKKISPLGSGLYKFIDMSDFNRLSKGNYGIPTLLSEIFGIYRRNDNIHILFSSVPFEAETFIAITIGDEIMIKMRTQKKNGNDEYYEKTAIKKDWNQQPAEPYFINVTINSDTRRISLYNLDEHEPFLSMDICNYYDYDDIQYMGVTSDKFKSVELYYDCCHPDEMENCHFSSRISTDHKSDLSNEEKNLSTTEDHENVTDVTTTESGGTTFSTFVTDDENVYNTTTMMRGEDNGEKENEETEESEEAEEEEEEEDDFEEEDDDEFEIEVEVNDELKNYSMGVNLTKTYLDTSGFYRLKRIKYFYKGGESDLDLCPEDVKAEHLKESTEAISMQNSDDDDDSGSPLIDYSRFLSSLVG